MGLDWADAIEEEQKKTLEEIEEEQKETLEEIQQTALNKNKADGPIAVGEKD